MRIRPLPFVSLALAAAMFGVTATAGAQPTPCDGQFEVVGAALDLGAPADAIRQVVAAQIVTPGGPTSRFVVRLGEACTAAVVTQAPRTDAFALRTRFVACGDRPRFRMRLLFDADCAGLAGTVRSAGQVIAEFTARRTGPADAVADPNRPPVTPPAIPPTPSVALPAPKLTVTNPTAARAGEEISLFGTDLDRDATGALWTDRPPYRVIFPRANLVFGTDRAAFRFISSTELRVTVPNAAGSGVIQLVERRDDGGTEAVLAETLDRFIVALADRTPPPAPVQGTPPSSPNRGALTVQATALNAISPGTFVVDGSRNQVGAFVDLNRNQVVDLASGRIDVPYLAFPVRTSSVDMTVTQGRGYFAGADAMVWAFFEGGDPNVLDNRDVFVTVHLDVDIAAGTARPVGIVAGVAGAPGIVISSDQFSEFAVTVDAPVIGGPGAIRGHIAAVPSFIELIFIPSEPSVPGAPDISPGLEQRLWANGIVLDFDVPLFKDSL